MKMNQNFTNQEMCSMFNAFGKNLSMRVNKAGNIDLVDPNRKNKNEHFVLYLTPNHHYLWRRWFTKDYCYPLNMRHRNDMTECTYIYSDGSTCNYKYYDFAKHAEFDTVDEAIEYFKNYLKKYRNINC